MILAIGGVDCLDLTCLMTCDLYVFTRLFHRSINVSKKSRETEAQCIRICKTTALNVNLMILSIFELLRLDLVDD